MINYRPVPFASRLGQEAPAAPAPAGPATTPAAPVPAAAAAPATQLGPGVAVPVSGYTGVPGFLETITVLGVTAAATWVGIRTGMSKQPNDLVKVAGWVGGIGSGLLGLLYLGQKAGVQSGLPRVQVMG